VPRKFFPFYASPITYGYIFLFLHRNWKSRARKLTIGKILDTAKVTALVTESLTLPFISRSKHQLRLLLEGASPTAALATEADGMGAGKRGSKPPQALSGSSTTLTVLDPVMYTSEEEKANPNRTGMVVRYPFANSDMIAAPVPKSLWPVEKIPFPPLVVQTPLSIPIPPQMTPSAPISTPTPPGAPPTGTPNAGMPRAGSGPGPVAAGAGVGMPRPGGVGATTSLPPTNPNMMTGKPAQYRKPGVPVVGSMAVGGGAGNPNVNVRPGGATPIMYGNMSIPVQHSVKLPSQYAAAPQQLAKPAVPVPAPASAPAPAAATAASQPPVTLATAAPAPSAAAATTGEDTSTNGNEQQAAKKPRVEEPEAES
jgi:hypothetical protein